MLRPVEANIIKLAVVSRRTRALITIDSETLHYRVVDCSRKLFCRIHVSKSCPPYCPVIVAAKDFVSGRREPKAEVALIE
ncbi:MAG: hypothetical protein H0Z19_00625 [Archaeoglobus sp.]|uniref:hypothetical protein n=1 Tax=Archaeoglobus sp. TaxID=1872626 RepID=UPI001D540EC3|nr:hypothetical protein [Archaeoglobus sp.]MBO8178978.1 hypothetical protein [Archaeoglobus sp.]